MRDISRLAKIGAVVAALAASSLLPALSRAQGTDKGTGSGQDKTAQQGPKVNPKESKAYKAFYDTSAQDADKRIQLGEAFVKQYPSGPYTEAVYASLVQAYYMKQDWNNMYGSADKALAMKPDDVDVLTQVGWVIPHVYNPSDPNASQLLDKSQTYETKALQDIPNLTKPADMTDDQFTTLKAEKLAEAHSGLGLVYFRRQDYDKAAKELQQATQGNPSPDPTDYLALGAALQNMQQYSQAVDAFDHCAQMQGALQNQCKQYEDSAKKLAAQGK